MLTDQEISFFNTFGFLVMKKVFGDEELHKMDLEFAEAMERGYRHMPFDGTRRHWLTMMDADTPFFASLMEDERLAVVAEQLYGDDVIGLGCDANRYVGDTKWHPDTLSIHQYGVKFAFYLDAVDANSGALRVVPGSHRNPLHDDLHLARKEERLPITEVPAHVCISNPADVVAFDLRLWHASWGGSDDRRMCTVVYYNNPKIEEEDRVTREQGQRSVKSGEKFGIANGPIHSPEWRSNPNGNPRRARWIERLKELDYPGF